MSAPPLTAQSACRSMQAVTGPSAPPLSCSTADCRRTPASGYAMCDRCIGDVLFGPLPERIQIARLSETDPIAQGIAAEISARSGR